MNPQNTNAPGGTQNFDGFGGPNISYESFSEPAPQPQPTPQQQINVVNANGVISGRRMVDYMWQRLAYCGLVFSVIFLIGLIVAVIFVGMMNTDRATMEAEKTAMERNLNGLYQVIGASNQEEAIQTLDKESEYINGGDMAKIDKLLTGKYGDYVVDFADSNINFVRINNMYKVVSVGIVRPNGTARALLYSLIADGNWKLGGFDSANTKDPCANSSNEEKVALQGIIVCPEVKEEEEDKKKPEEKKDPEENPEENPDEEDDSGKEDKDKTKAE